MNLCLFTWLMMIFCLRSSTLEVTVKQSQLMLCEEDEHVCVSDPRDCSYPPSSSALKTLNMSCYYQNPSYKTASMTCGWTGESEKNLNVSLIFTSGNKVLSCRGIFNPAASLNVRARIRNYETGSVIWSHPHSVFLLFAMKPFPPSLTVLGSTEDSLLLTWRSRNSDSCLLRYKPKSTSSWTQDSIAVQANQNVSYTLTELQPFTVYQAAVACRGKFSLISDWSSAVTAKTLQRVPSRPSDLGYRLEKTGAGISSLLHLIWKPPNFESCVVGYEVTLTPDGKVKNVTDTMALLVVEEGNYTVTIRAFNTAGFGPAAQLRINTQRQTTLPSIRNLWVSTYYPGNQTLQVQWKLSSSIPSLTHLVIEWRPETTPSRIRWTRVSNVTTCTVIPDLDVDESYVVTVFPVRNYQTGPHQSLSASLQQGALMEVVNLKVVNVTKTTVSVMWVWQRKSSPIRVDGYSLMLQGEADRCTHFLWPDQWQHTFSRLTSNTEYSLLLLADDVSRDILTVSTVYDEIPVVAMAIPLMLLIITMVIIFILSRTIYRSYFFPPISSPKCSSVGRWLMDPNLQKSAEPKILDLEELHVLRNRSLIIDDPAQLLPSDDLPPTRTTCSVVQMFSLRLDTVFVCDAPPITEWPADQSSLLLNQLKEENPSERSFCFMNGYPMSREADSSYPICQPEYLSNSCFRAETTEEEKTVCCA